jgi:hypothetical protein
LPNEVPQQTGQAVSRQTRFRTQQMGRFFLNIVAPLAIVMIGVVSGVLPPPSVPALWAFGVITAVCAIWLLVHSYGWAQAGIFAAVAIAVSFCTEFILVNPMALLVHYSHPQVAGVSALALLQDFVMVAASYVFACALLPTGGVFAKAAGSGTLLLAATLIAGPPASTLGYYTYNPPFLSWPADLGIQPAPPVPWAEPIGNPIIVILTSIVFAGFASLRHDERPFSVKWAALLYSTQVLAAWAWIACRGYWMLFAVSTVLLAGIVAWSVRAGWTGARNEPGV